MGSRERSFSEIILFYLCSFYRLSNGTKIDLDKSKMTEAAQTTKQYSNEYEYDMKRQRRSYEQPVEIFVVNADCLDLVMCFKKKYPDCNPVVLNMASATSPGGGWRHGIRVFVFWSYIYLLLFP
jgi:uncharacterized protein (TIGR02452 family)